MRSQSSAAYLYVELPGRSTKLALLKLSDARLTGIDPDSLPQAINSPCNLLCPAAGPTVLFKIFVLTVASFLAKGSSAKCTWAQHGRVGRKTQEVGRDVGTT